MLLFLYVLKDFFKYVVGIIALSTFLFVLFDFIHKSTKYLAKYEPETKHLVSFYIYQIPNLVVQGLPIAALLGGVITMVLLNRTNEITAMRAIGMGPWRIGAPIAFGGLCLSCFSFVFGEFVLPRSAEKSHYIQNVLIEKSKSFQMTKGAKWIRNGRVLLTFKDYDRNTRSIKDVRVIYTGKSFRPKRTIESSSAMFDFESNKWVLKKVKVFYFWPNGTLSYTENRNDYQLDFPLEPERLKKELRLANEMSSSELSELVYKGEASGIDVLHYKVDYHVKIAFHFASLVLCLIGIKFAYTSERSMETARGILLAIAVGVSYWFILNAGRALGKRGTLPPFFAAWIANVVIMFLALYPLLKRRSQ